MMRVGDAQSTEPAAGMQPIGALIDVPRDALETQRQMSMRRWGTGAGLTLLLLIPGTIVLIVVLVNLSLLWQYVVGGSVAFAILGSFFVYDRHIVRRGDSIIASSRDSDVGVWIRRVISEEGGPPIAQLLGRLVTEVLSGGGRNVTLRLGAPVDANPVEALVVPFEPIPLDETSDAFEELADVCRGPPGDNGAAQTGEERRVIRKMRARFRQSGGWIGFVFAAIFTLQMMISAARATRFAYVVLAWPIIAAWWMLRSSKSWSDSSTQWLVIPGGVAVRSRRWRRKAWKVEVLARSRAVLCAFREVRGLWHVIVAEPDLRFERNCTMAELELLLRAWLSPLEPPEAGMLSDLV